MGSFIFSFRHLLDAFLREGGEVIVRSLMRIILTAVLGCTRLYVIKYSVGIHFHLHMCDVLSDVWIVVGRSDQLSGKKRLSGDLHRGCTKLSFFEFLCHVCISLVCRYEM